MVMYSGKGWNKLCKENNFDEDNKYAKEVAKQLDLYKQKVEGLTSKDQLKLCLKIKKPLDTAIAKIKKENSAFGTVAEKEILEELDSTIKSCQAIAKPLEATAKNVTAAINLAKSFKGTTLAEYGVLYRADEVRLLNMGLVQAMKDEAVKPKVQPIHATFKSKMTSLDSGKINDEPTEIKMAAQGMLATLQELDKAAKDAKLWK